MLAKPLARSGWNTAAPPLDRVAGLLFLLISALYFMQAVRLASSAPYWMDEVLALWTSRLASPQAIWGALKQGSEFSPPLYALFLHQLQQWGITAPLGLRLPSILAVYGVALATGVLARRHVGAAPAALAAAIVLSGGLFGYAVQMRPYAMVTAAFAGALLLYDRPGRPMRARLIGMGLLLTLGIALHFYALLLVGVLAAVELVRARAERRAPSVPVLATLAAASATILLWWPILVAARAYAGADVAAPDYYAQPTIVALARSYVRLMGWQGVALVALLAASVLGARPKGTLYPMALVLTAVPALVFLFALLVSHSYADRYVLAGVIGVALLFAALAQALGRHAGPVSVALLAMLAAGTGWRDGGELAKADRIAALAAVRDAPGTLPIVTGSGLRYFELRQNLAIGDRLIFLDTPGDQPGDPTNRNQVMRWKAIDPTLSVRDAAAFLCSHPVFDLFVQPQDGGADPLPDWLVGKADFAMPGGGGAAVIRVRARPCPPPPAPRD